ncbi:hypothetical protein LTR56_009760 [Elasticomyces elasticus]|nr:hypothetical protein LTR56_009760 [Elasticomyces elasticus]KAK4919179.1 hypothetical protein LTR49_013183 [Elasticomyces elasticus]
MAESTSNTLLAKLMVSALNWNGDSAQEDQQLAYQLYVSANNECAAAEENISRVKTLLAESDQYSPRLKGTSAAATDEIASLKAQLAEREQDMEAIQQVLTAREREQDRAPIDKPAPLAEHRENSVFNGITLPTGPRDRAAEVATNITTAPQQDGNRGTERQSSKRRDISPLGHGSYYRPHKRTRAVPGRRTPVCGYCDRTDRRHTCDGAATCITCSSRGGSCYYAMCGFPDCDQVECGFLHKDQWDQEREPGRKVSGVNYKNTKR